MIAMERLASSNNCIVCPVCGSKKLLALFSKESMPRYNLEQHYDRDSALTARIGKVAFYFCQACLFAFNAAFDELEMDYAVDYESSRSHSKYFDNYLDKVCKDLGGVFNVANKTIVEIGCGDGHFLRKLRGNYEFKGYGFDPSLNTNKIEQSRDLEFIKGYYSYGSLNISPDIIILRHILEHQKNPHSFFNQITPKTQTNDPLSIYIEVPAWEWIIDNNSIYALSYEHCSYYSKYSIEYALRTHNFYPQNISFTFDNEYLQYYGVNLPVPKTVKYAEAKSKKAIIEKSELFRFKIRAFLEELKKQVSGISDDTVLWGAGGKGTTLLNLLDINYNQLKYVVDSNPARHNTYIPRTGQQVVSPEFLKELKPEHILITNHNYYDEIRSQILKLGLPANIISIDKLLKDVHNKQEA